MTAAKAAPYQTTWCAQPNEVRGVNGHRRCTSTKCTCLCHGINAAADRALTTTKEITR